nr:MAG: hypothetical protein DIU70_10105 [Bacillota bacterium]
MSSARWLAPILAAVSLLASGCWSRRESNDLAVVLGSGVDRAESGALQVSLALARPGGDGSGGGNRQDGGMATGKRLVTAEGRTIADALQSAQRQMADQITLHHNRVILVGQELARSGLEPLLDYALRNPEVRLTNQLVVVEGTARAALDQIPDLESYPTKEVSELLLGRFSPLLELKDVLAAYYDPAEEPLVPRLTLIPEGGEGEGRPRLRLNLDGAYLYQGDRWVGEFTHRELTGWMWLRGLVRDQVITVPCPGDSDRHLSVRVARGKAHVAPYASGAEVGLQVRLVGYLFLLELQCPVHPITPEVLQDLEAAVARDVSVSVTEAIRKAQAAGADVFGFGALVRSRLPGYWPDLEPRWNEAFRQIRITVAPPRMTIIHTMMSQ